MSALGELNANRRSRSNYRDSSEPSDNYEFKTPEVFQRCLRSIFTIADIQQVEGLDHPVIGLDIGEVVGKEPYMERIYIEPEYLEAMKD